MTKPKRKNDKSTEITVGDISGVNGTVNIAGGDITTHHTSGLSGPELQQLFDTIYTRIESRPQTPPAQKEDLKAEVQEIQETVTEAAKEKKKVDEGFLAHRFRNIARMAPDILEVVVAALANPLAGLGVAVRKIAEKATSSAPPQPSPNSK